MCSRRSDLQPRQPAQTQIGPPYEGFWFENPIRQTTKHLFKSDLAFDACQRCTKTEVNAPAEGEMTRLFGEMTTFTVSDSS